MVIIIDESPGQRKLANTALMSRNVIHLMQNMCGGKTDELNGLYYVQTNLHLKIGFKRKQVNQ